MGDRNLSDDSFNRSVRRSNFTYYISDTERGGKCVLFLDFLESNPEIVSDCTESSVLSV